eukprot:11257349-Karenia_brevis.AAC.1
MALTAAAAPPPSSSSSGSEWRTWAERVEWNPVETDTPADPANMRPKDVESLVMNTGAVDDLTGLDSALLHAAVAEREGYTAQRERPEVPKKLSGVGDQVKICTHQVRLMRALETVSPSPVPPL